jgi:hypothetical protein
MHMVVQDDGYTGAVSRIGLGPVVGSVTNPAKMAVPGILL